MNTRTTARRPVCGPYPIAPRRELRARSIARHESERDRPVLRELDGDPHERGMRERDAGYDVAERSMERLVEDGPLGRAEHGAGHALESRDLRGDLARDRRVHQRSDTCNAL